MTAPRNVTAVSVTAVHKPAVAVSVLSATAVSRNTHRFSDESGYTLTQIFAEFFSRSRSPKGFEKQKSPE